MANISSPNKTIAKNTVFLYFRMIVTMLISFYTSRVLLQTLGVDDFGTYGLVGGIVSIFASLKTMFTVATQRFMNIEMGHGNMKGLNKVFNVSILVNIVLAAIFIIVVEIGGIWLLNTKLHVAPERMDAARWVFHISVLTSAIGIFNIPFSANIIAREKMNVIAFVSIYDALAKLAIVLLLPIMGGDKLIWYGLLLMTITISNLLIEAIYCRSHFEENRFRRYPLNEVKVKFKGMFSFSGWSFFGNVVFALVNEGINVLLNIFGSLSANAARTVAYQVRSAINNLISNVYTATKPQIIQSYARQDMDRLYKLMFTGCKVVGYMYILIAIPLYFTMDEVLKLWLGSVPEYAVSFLSLCLIYQFLRVLHTTIDTFFITIGRLKEYQITEFIVQGMALPASYVGLKIFNMPLYGVFIVLSVFEVLNLCAILILAKKIGKFNVRGFITSVILPYSVMTAICYFCIFLLKQVLTPIAMNTTLKTFVIIGLAVIIEMFLLSIIGLSKNERNLFISMVKRKK